MLPSREFWQAWDIARYLRAPIWCYCTYWNIAYKNNVNFTPGILSGYQKYERLAGLSKKGGCGIYIRHSTIHNKTRPKYKFQKNTKWIWGALVRNNKSIKR